MKHFKWIQTSAFKLQGSAFPIPCALFLLFTLFFIPTAQAVSQKVIFISPVVYRADGQGDTGFKDGGRMGGTVVGADGVVRYVKSPGIYEITRPIAANDKITRVSAHWKFTGAVTLEVSATGRASDYVRIINGVPLEKGQFLPGTTLMWRATLEPGSTLSEVNISTSDASGAVGGFGEAELTGFTRGKKFIVSGQAAEAFNHQVRVRVGASEKTADCDVILSGGVREDFADVRFTAADGQTLLAYYLESVTEVSGQKTAVFWVKVPEIPAEGLSLFLYYGNAGARSLSDGAGTFDFFNGFKDGSPGSGIWDTSVPGTISVLSYVFKKGVIEFKAQLGAKTYSYSLVYDGKVQAFQKQDENKVLIETSEPELIDKDALKKGVVSFTMQNARYEWIRIRQASGAPSEIDIEKTRSTADEATNLPRFKNVKVAPNGDLVLADGADMGEYLSALIPLPFKARVVVPSWHETRLAQADNLQPSTEISISAGQSGVFTKNCENNKSYYASKKEFMEANQMRFKIGISSASRSQETPIYSLTSFSLDSRSGAIRVITPNGGESIASDVPATITWNASEYDPSYPMALSYSADGGKNYRAINLQAANIGRYLWDLSGLTGQRTADSQNVITDQALVKVSDALDTTVYDVSNALFSIVQSSTDQVQGTTADNGQGSGDRVQGTEVTPETKADKTPPPPNLYELLIKQEERDRDGKPTAAGRNSDYQPGDIIMIKPAGYLWGAEERSEFVVVQAYLTREDVKELMSPKTARDGAIISRRRHKIDMSKKNIKDKVEGMLGAIRGKPLLDRQELEEKK